MRQLLPFFITALFFASGAHAQDVRYVSDKQFIPLRSGPGGEFRIVHRGIPSGTKLTVSQTSDDGVFSEITTDRGTSGWIRSQYLMQELPAQTKLDAATRRAESLAEKNTAIAAELSALKAERGELAEQVSDSGSELEAINEELQTLKQISGKAVQLDVDNRRLVEETENMRSQLGMLQAENQRLQDNSESEAFINGALAVLLGVIITLVAPRLWPKRRSSSSWA